MTIVLSNGEPVELGETGPLTAILHGNDIRVESPYYFEINGRNTLKCMEEMSQRAWVHISTGSIFQHLFNKAFVDCPEVKIPATIEELNNMDFGVIHVSGMIVLAIEALIEGKRVFFRTPETHLHPKVTRCLVDMINDLLKIGNSLAAEPGCANLE